MTDVASLLTFFFPVMKIALSILSKPKTEACGNVRENNQNYIFSLSIFLGFLIDEKD